MSALSFIGTFGKIFKPDVLKERFQRFTYIVALDSQPWYCSIITWTWASLV